MIYYSIRTLAPAGVSSRFFFNDTATTEIYTLSLHDALPISHSGFRFDRPNNPGALPATSPGNSNVRETLQDYRSEEHTSELQSPDHLVCRLLLEKKKIVLPVPLTP